MMPRVRLQVYGDGTPFIRRGAEIGFLAVFEIFFLKRSLSMNRRFLLIFGSLVLFVGVAAHARAADIYTIDPIHSGVNFKISHVGLSWVYGRFDSFSGNFSIDADDAGKATFELKINTDSVDTNNKQRDTHLRSPDFFNVKQFPAITFESTAVKAIDKGYEVTGNLTMHGVTKPVTFSLVGGKKAQFPPGTSRTGYSTELIIKRMDFGVGQEKFAGALGEDVHVAISFEGVLKK
jgi:polyisoprenoid-binding protein YceI